MHKGRLLLRTGSIVIPLMLFLIFVSLCPGLSSAAVPKDYVVVIDISTSMQDIFDEVKELAKKTIGKAQTGDNVTVITFGEQTKLLDRRMVHGNADKESLQKQVDELYPTDYATYINRGLEKGLSELRYLFEKHPDRERVLLWLSDDKDNPPEGIGEEFITLDKVREENRNFEPGNEWFAYNAPLSEVENRILEDFVTWARRTTFRVVVKEENIKLGPFEDGNVNKTVVLTFEPRHPGTAGLKFTAEASFVDPKNPDRSIPVTLSPERVVASGHLWQEQFQIAFKGDPGEYEGFLSFRSLSGDALDVEPRTVPMTAMIIPPKLASADIEVPVEAPKPEGLLAEAKDKGIIATEDRPPGLTRPEKPLEFGPLEPGKKDSKIITLYLNKETDPKGITLDSSIKLPQGVSIGSEVFGKGVRKAAEITISVEPGARLAESDVLQEAYEGTIRFKSVDAEVQVLPVYVPIRVAFNTDRVRWGKRILPQAGVDQYKARGMTFEQLTEELEEGAQEKPEGAGAIISALGNVYSKLTAYSLFYPLLAVVVLLLVLLLYRMRPASQLFAGELVIIKDPTDSNMKNVNLKRIGSLHDKNALTLGSSSKADIRLPHGSVAPMHCRLSTKTSEGRSGISIQPLKGTSIKVNDIEQPTKTRLSDKDLIGIGDFILLFSNPEAQKSVVVHFLDGRTMRGTPVTWDIASPSFELLRIGSEEMEETTEEITVVNFVDLKAVFFVQDSAGGGLGVPKEKINTDELLEVTFFDGEKVEGHPLTDYSDVARRFYLVPKEMPNIISILVERQNIKESVTRTSPAGAEAKEGGLLRRRKGTASAE